MCSSWVKKESHKNTTLEQSMARFYMYIHLDKKIFTLDSSFQISSNQTGRSIFRIYEFACEQQNDSGTKLFWSFLLKCKRCLKWIYTCSTEKGQYTAIFTEQAWSIRDLLNGQNIAPLMGGKTREITSRQVRPILPPRVANQNAEFTSSWPLPDSAI